MTDSGSEACVCMPSGVAPPPTPTYTHPLIHPPTHTPTLIHPPAAPTLPAPTYCTHLRVVVILFMLSTRLPHRTAVWPSTRKPRETRRRFKDRTRRRTEREHYQTLLNQTHKMAAAKGGAPLTHRPTASPPRSPRAGVES